MSHSNDDLTDHTLRKLLLQLSFVKKQWVPAGRKLWRAGDACLTWHMPSTEQLWFVGFGGHREITVTLLWAGATPFSEYSMAERWNDDEDRSYTEVLAVLDATIERVETWGLTR